jgi:hypothetical protein
MAWRAARGRPTSRASAPRPLPRASTACASTTAPAAAPSTWPRTSTPAAAVPICWPSSASCGRTGASRGCDRGLAGRQLAVAPLGQAAPPGSSGPSPSPRSPCAPRALAPRAPSTALLPGAAQGAAAAHGPAQPDPARCAVLGELGLTTLRAFDDRITAPWAATPTRPPTTQAAAASTWRASRCRP